MQLFGCLIRQPERTALERKSPQETSNAGIVVLKHKQHDITWGYSCSRRGRVSLFHSLDFSGPYPPFQYFGWVFLNFLHFGVEKTQCLVKILKGPTKCLGGKEAFSTNLSLEVPAVHRAVWQMSREGMSRDEIGTLSCCVNCHSSSHVAAKFLLSLMTQ